VEMCRPRVGAANLLFSLWRALWRPTAPASRTKSRRMAEECRTRVPYEIFLTANLFRICIFWYKITFKSSPQQPEWVHFQNL
jgi:hypothetical protein